MSHFTLTFYFLSGLCALLTFLFKESKSESTSSDRGQSGKDYKNFRLNYLIVYLLVMSKLLKRELYLLYLLLKN